MISAATEETLPLVSVIIPAYNAERFIRQTLESVLAQTYQNIEVLVVDDGSQDQTGEIVREFATRDDRILLLTQPNSGVAAARNLAIQHSNGEFVAPIDADDIWHPQNIEKQVKCIMQADSSVGVVYSWSFDIDEKNQPTGNFHASTIEGKVYATLLCHYFLGHGSCSLIRRNCLDKVNGYNPQLKNSCEDWDLYLRIAENHEFKAVPEFLACYQKKNNGLSQNLASMKEAHTSILESSHKRRLKIPFIIYRLSNSSFCIYLAHQSYFKEDFRSALMWIYEAFKSSFVLSLLRPSACILPLKSIFRMAIIYSEIDSKKSRIWFRKSLDCTQELLNSKEFSLFISFRPCRAKRQLKTFYEFFLHQSIKNILRTSNSVSSISNISWKG